MDASYYSGKLECYLRFREYTFERVLATTTTLAELYQTTGMAEVPQLFDRREQRWLRDSSAIIEYLELTEHGDAPHQVLPRDPATRFVSHLVEDFADEWLWTPAMHYRWWKSLDSRTLSLDFSMRGVISDERFAPSTITRPLIAFRQLNEYVTSFGVRSQVQADAMERIYIDMLDVLERHFSRVAPFMLGAKPTLVDFGFAASMFRHFSSDPTPSKIMRDRAPAVYEWVARLWNASSPRSTRIAEIDSTTMPNANVIPPSWAPILERIRTEYVPYLEANAVALRDGRHFFDFGVFRGTHVSEFRAQGAARLADRLAALSPEDRRRVAAAVGESVLVTIERIPRPSRSESYDSLPICALPRGPRLLGVMERERIKLLGTPRHAEAGPLSETWLWALLTTQLKNGISIAAVAFATRSILARL